MNWRTASIVLAIGLVAAVGLTWLWRDSVCRGQRSAADSTVTEHASPVVVNVPPAVVMPPVAQAKPRPDLTDKRRADSLQGLILSKDSALKLATIRESILASLLTTKEGEQTFRIDTENVSIVGRLKMLYFPVDGFFKGTPIVDSLVVPERVKTIVKYVAEETTNWRATSIVGALCLVLGVALGVFL